MNQEQIQQLYESGEINEYFYNQILRKIGLLPENVIESYIDEARDMSALGIDNAEDQKIFFYILLHTDDILKCILEEKTHFYQFLPQISDIIFKNRKEYPIDTMMNFYMAVTNAAEQIGLPLKKSIINELQQMPEEIQQCIRDKQAGIKVAYPQGWGGDNIKKPYDIKKWMRATRDIYMMAEDLGYQDAFEHVTENWDKMEQQDYKHWLSFYQENAHNKYKKAQKVYTNDYGYVLPISHDNLKGALPSPIKQPKDKFKEEERKIRERQDVNDARERIETQRSKIISRLNSAEKLLSSLDGQLFAGDNQERMLELLQDLKRRVQTANKLRAQSSLFEDFIYRTANYCLAEGNKRGAKFFYKIAQEKDNLESAKDLLGDGPDLEGDLEGAMEGASDMPEMPDDIPMEDELVVPEEPGKGEVEPEKTETQKAFEEFFSRLESGVHNDFDKDDELYVDDSFLFSTAQQAQAPPPKPVEPIEVAEDPKDSHNKGTEAIERALSSVNIYDLINHLEYLSAIFKRRELSRQLAIADLMMDRLGIGSYFPSLGEASRSALDSNQYISTRVEEILSKIRGTVAQDTDELFEPEQSAGANELGEALEKEQEKEEAAKERRKKMREQKEEAKFTKEPPVGGAGEQATQELAQPAQVEQGKPIPTR